MLSLFLLLRLKRSTECFLCVLAHVELGFSACGLALLRAALGAVATSTASTCCFV